MADTSEDGVEAVLPTLVTPMAPGNSSGREFSPGIVQQDHGPVQLGVLVPRYGWIPGLDPPQTQATGIVWPGFNTEGVPRGALSGNTVSVKLVSASGPADVSVYTTSALGTPTVWFDSGNGLPDTRSIAINTHAHANWAFEAAGTYTVVFEVTATTAGGSAVSTGQKTYTFTVQSLRSAIGGVSAGDLSQRSSGMISTGALIARIRAVTQSSPRRRGRSC